MFQKFKSVTDTNKTQSKASSPKLLSKFFGSNSKIVWRPDNLTAQQYCDMLDHA